MGRAGGGSRSSSRSSFSGSRSSFSRSSSSFSSSRSSSRGSYSRNRSSSSRSSSSRSSFSSVKPPKPTRPSGYSYKGNNTHVHNNYSNSHIRHDTNRYHRRPNNSINITNVTMSNNSSNMSMGGYGRMNMGGMSMSSSSPSNNMSNFGNMGMGGPVKYKEKYIGHESYKVSSRKVFGIMACIVAALLFLVGGVYKEEYKDMLESIYKKPSIAYECSDDSNNHVYADTFFANKSYVAHAYHEVEDILGFPIFLYCVDESTVEASTAREFLEDVYKNSFNDENHILIGYFNDIDYWEWVIGDKVKNNFGEYEVNLLIDRYYDFWDDTSLSNEDVFVEGIYEFIDRHLYTNENAAKTKESSDKLFIWGRINLVAGIILLISSRIAKVKEEKKKEKERQDKELSDLLSKPLETFGNQEIENLKDKYN